MINLKEIRGRIQSISSIIQITGAMKMVSISKLKKAKNSLLNVYPYIKKIEELLTTFSYQKDLNNFQNSFQKIYGKPKLIIAISSNKGLCGGFNTSIARLVTNQMKLNQPIPYLITIGKKIKDLLNNYFKIYQDYSILLNSISYNEISSFCNILINKFFQKKFHSIHLIYNKLKNNTIQKLILKQILPIKIPKKLLGNFQINYLLDSPKSTIIKELIIKSVKIYVFNAILESYTAEQFFRMIAMNKANDNAFNLKKELLLTYNKIRQTTITKEILEILGGSETFNF